MAANQTWREPAKIITLPGTEGNTFRITPIQHGLSYAAVYNSAGQIVPPGRVKLYNMSVKGAPRESKTLSPTDHRFFIHQYFHYRVAYDGKTVFDLIVSHHVEHYE